MKADFILVYLRYLYVVAGVGYVTVSAKIPRKLKELLDRYGVKPGPVIRRALEEEVKKRVLEELEKVSRGLLQGLSDIPDEEVVRLIREDREGR